MYAFWACKDIGNFGDCITPYLLNKLGCEVEFSWMQGVVLDGSILGIVKENHVVFGAGFMNLTDKCEAKDVRYCRGEISKTLLKQQGFKDVKTHIPAFCLKEFISDKTPTKETGYALHYVDYTDFGVDVCKPVEQVVNEILDHENIITSSLHAYIVSRMYGRGVALVKSNNIIYGDGMKYADAFSCWGETSFPIPLVTDSVNINAQIKKTVGNPIKFDNKQFLKDLNDYLCQL